MKCLHPGLLALFIPMLATAQSSRTLNAFSKINLTEKTFTLTGKFTGYDTAVDKFRYCKIIYNHLFKDEQQNHAGEVNANGTFRLSFPLNRPQEIMFTFEDELVLFYGVPGSTLNITLDLAAFKALQKLPYVEQLKHKDPLTFSGQYAQLNEECKVFRPTLYTLLNFRFHQTRIDSLDQMAYKAFRTGIMATMLDSLDAFNKRNNSSAEFRQVMTQYIRYHAAEDLLRYHWLHDMSNKKRKRINLTPEYLQFLTDMPVNNDEALVTEAYSTFLREYVGYLQMRDTTRHSLDVKTFIGYLRENGQAISPEEEKKLTTPAGTDSAQQKLVEGFFQAHASERNGYFGNIRVRRSIDALLAEVPAGRGRDILITRILNSQLNRERIPFGERSLQQYTSYLADASLKTLLFKENTRLRDLLEGKMPATSQVRSSLQVSSDKVFDEMMKPYQGKVVYIDFWAPWCGPCMGEMPYSAELKKELAGKDVVFLYIGISCSKQSWENTIKDKGIQGEHYFADDNEGKLLSDKFNISGIPHYVLVDKTGKVADNKAQRPSEKAKLLKRINSLLNK